MIKRKFIETNQNRIFNMHVRYRDIYVYTAQREKYLFIFKEEKNICQNGKMHTEDTNTHTQK